MAELPSGTVTFLFTDLVDSTRLWDEHPTDMKVALARHDAILRDLIARHGGEVVKKTGDGVHAAFAGAPDAVAMATDALRTIASETWGGTGPLLVRIGMHTGTAELRDGDYYGSAVNRASRIMAAAHGGQAILSHATAELVRDSLTDELGIMDLGEHRLRGLARAEHMYQLVISGLPSQFPPVHSVEVFPGSLPFPLTPFARVDQALAGRELEFDTLKRAWAKSTDGDRQVALVTGEPGIGKTRLVGELSRHAFAEGAVVLYGRCDEEATMPYQPFVEALRPYVARCPTAKLREWLHGLEIDLSRVFPELVGRMPELSARAPIEPVEASLPDPEAHRQAERYRLFEAFTALLSGIAATQSTVLVLDDLHWADRPTVLLLRHLLRSAPRAALLVVACYRDVDVAREQPVSDLLADLRREESVSWVTLRGLSESASTDLVFGVAGHSVGPELTQALFRETDGNPFFLEELVRHLIETEALVMPGETRTVDLGALDLPQGVRDVIARRLRRLPDAVNDVLNVGAVVGPEFDAELVRRVARRTAVDVLDALDQATDAGLVAEHPGRMGRYSFTHALIRQTLYAELKTAQRVRLHERVGTAIEESGAGRAQSAAVLAHHFTHAVPLVGTLKAIEYSIKAGHDAVADLAFEDAVSHFDRALGLLDQHPPVDMTQRVELLTDLADALVFVDERDGVRVAMRAVDAARANASSWQLGRAVTVLAEANSAVAVFPSEFPRIFDEAQTALGEDHSALRARLQAQEAFKYISYQLQGRNGRALARAAVTLARETSDPVTLGDALFALATGLEGAPDLAERVALGEELVALGRSAGSRPLTYGLRILAGTQLELGDPVALTATIDELARVGKELRWLPARVATAQLRATQALLEGRFDDIGAHWDEMRWYRRAYGGAGGMRAVQSFFLAREQGQLVSTAPPERLAEQARGNLYARAMFGLTQLESGDEGAAAATLDLLETDDFHRQATEGAWVAVLALFTEIAATRPAPAHLTVLHDLLTPYSGRLLCAHLGLACLGSADRYLAMLSTVLGRWDDAAAQFEGALTVETRIGGRALLPRTRYWQARMLRARGDTGDDRAAGALLDEVIAETSTLGMARLRAQAEELRGS
ncbi:MAG TPA: AAA family ATPase [Acidimicrobiia bacterium]|nr:AAA family ATPase [Acidimicrobiia bacterium]